MQNVDFHPSLDISNRPVKRRVYNRRDPAPGYPHSVITTTHITSPHPPHRRSPSLIHPKPQQEISATTTKNNIISNQRSNPPPSIEKAKEDRHKADRSAQRSERAKSVVKKDVRGIQGMGESNVTK